MHRKKAAIATFAGRLVRRPGGLGAFRPEPILPSWDTRPRRRFQPGPAQPPQTPPGLANQRTACRSRCSSWDGSSDALATLDLPKPRSGAIPEVLSRWRSAGRPGSCHRVDTQSDLARACPMTCGEQRAVVQEVSRVEGGAGGHSINYQEDGLRLPVSGGWEKGNGTSSGPVPTLTCSGRRWADQGAGESGIRCRRSGSSNLAHRS